MNESTIYVKTDRLTVGYSSEEKKLLFKELNLSLLAGQLVCFMGSNGIGKSTLIRTLAGLQKPWAGSISYPAKKKEAELEKWISLVLTDRIVTSNMTAYDLISYGRYPYLPWNLDLSPEDEKIVENAIKAARIENLADTNINELSDGQMQLAMITRALAQDTPVILLDEPTAHLDLNNRVEIMRLLRKVARTMNKAILVATHELDLALQTADVLWLASAERSITVGVPEDLVLNGILDETFSMKGFDLKTGKVNHDPYKKVAIQLLGNGHEFLWTKNALDREGYSIDGRSPIVVEVKSNGKKLEWFITSPDFNERVLSIEELLTQLNCLPLFTKAHHHKL